MNNMSKVSLALLLGSTYILHGCATPLATAAATSFGGYQTAQYSGYPAATGYNQVVSSSCSEMRTEMEILDKHITNYYEHQAASTMQQYPTSAGEQVATQAATDIAVRNAPSALPYLQPLLASAKGFMDDIGKPSEVKTAEARKELVLEQYNQKCVGKKVAGDSATREAQVLLNQIGYPCGVADGIAGQKTHDAIRRYQIDNGLPVDGRVSNELLAMLRRTQ